MRKSFIVLATLLLLFTLSCMQNNELEVKVDTLNDKAWKLSFNNPKEAIKISQQALLIADSIHYLKGQSDCNNRLGIYYSDISDFVQAESHFTKAIPIREEMKYFAGVAYVYDNLCRLRNEEGDYLGAIKYGFKGLNILEELGLESQEPTLFLNLAIAHHHNRDTLDAIKYYKKGLEIASNLNDTVNMAAIHFNWGQFHSNLKEFGDAKDHFNDALLLFIATNNKLGIAAIKDEFGIIFQQNKDYKNALIEFEESIEINKSIADSVRLFHNFLNISNLHFDQNNYKKALSFCDSSKHMLRNIKRLDDREMLKRTYSKIFEQIGDQNKHLLFYKQAEALEDSIYNIDKTRNIAKLQKGNAEKEKAQVEVKNQKLKTSLGITGFLILLSIFALYLLNQRRINKEREFNTYKEQQVRIIDQGIINATRSIRKELSTNLHNHVSTSLTHIKRYLEPIHQKLGYYPDFQKEIAEAMTLVDKTHFTSRDIAYKLKPEEIDWLDRIKVSITALNIKKGVEAYSNISGLSGSNFSSSDGEKISSILCNILSNVDKHSEATKVSVIIEQGENNLLVEVKDNGKGFDTERTKGIGLESIQSDVKLLGGTIIIKSKERRGTSISIKIPK